MMQKWSSINQFRHIVHYIKNHNKYDNLDFPTITFVGSVKLHGTNAGIRYEDGKFYAQSRTKTLTPQEDNFGFANWLNNRLQDETFSNEITRLFNLITTDDSNSATIYGEWCGEGIQNKVAVAQLSKRFVIFGAKVDEMYITDPNILKPSKHELLSDLDHVSTGGTYFVTVDFNDPEKSLEEINQITLDIEKRCPYASAHGVEGIGEGLVWVSVNDKANSSLWFKTKGSKHSGKSSRKKNAATVTPEKLESITKVVDYVLSEERLLQGLDNIDSLEMKHIGSYLKWIGKDILKEESDTIAANNLEWKDISKNVSNKARQFFINKIDSDF